MPLLARLRRWLLGERPLSARAADEPSAAPRDALDELPPFRLATAERMRFDPQVRIGLAARNGLLMAAEVEARSADRRVAEFVQRQWDRVWQVGASQLLRAKLYGFLPMEVMYREGRGAQAGEVQVDYLIDRAPARARLLVARDRVAGFDLLDEAGERRARVPAPKGLVATYDAEFANPYGCSLLARAYPAWYEKWMPGGAKKTLRLRMIKDAYVGDVFWYPPDRTIQLPDGREISWRDVARQVLEARTSGAAVTLPLVYDAEGRKVVDYSPPRDTGAATSIFEWKRDVDVEIWKALEVPPEVIEATRRGSFSGRSIPLVIATSAVQQELAELVRCVDRDVIGPLVRLHFPGGDDYQLRARPLLESLRKAWQGVTAGEAA